MDVKDEVKSRTDIADLIGGYLPLKTAGSGSFKGLCPFHAERTPSFHVSRERQIWKCFGCDRGGDVFSFVMEIEGMTFIEALRMLAARVGVEVPDRFSMTTAPRDNNEPLLAAHVAAVQFYQSRLHSGQSCAPVRAYLHERGISSDLAKKFQLGAADTAWDALAQHLRGQGFDDATLVTAGLCLRKKSGEGIVDRFRGRLMIPLCASSGAPVGFTARLIPVWPSDGPKYLNSPDTPIYHKSALLYGLHLAKTAVRHAGEVIIVEGNLDVIASHKAGVEHVVASSGTALTAEQLRLLARFTKRMVLCLDDDAAGFTAVQRAVQLALTLAAEEKERPWEVRCLAIPAGAGKDPDEVVAKDPELWKRLAVGSQPVVDFFFTKALQAFSAQGGVASADARRALVDSVLPTLARLERADERDIYLQRLADAIHSQKEVVAGMLAKVRAPSSAPRPSSLATPAPQKIARDDAVAAYLLAIILRDPSFLPAILPAVPLERLTDPWRALYTLAGSVYTTPDASFDSVAAQSFFARLRARCAAHDDPRSLRTLDALAFRADTVFADFAPAQLREEVERHLALFSLGELRRKKTALASDIRAAELAGQQERLAALIQEYTHLSASSDS